MEVKRTQTANCVSLDFGFCVGFCALGLFWEEGREIQSGGCGAVEKLKQMAGWFWKESIQRNTVNLLAALLLSGHCLS